MKKTIALLAILLFAAESPALVAKSRRAKGETTKTSMKAWKKRKKDMTPMQLKDIIEENHRLKALGKSLKKRNEELEEAAGHSKRALEETIVNLRAEIEALKKAQANGGVSQARNGQDEYTDVVEGSQEALPGEKHSKIIYKIQVGAYHSYKEAEAIKHKIRAQGHKDTWIVVFKNGKRIPLKEVLSEVLRDQ